MLEIEIQERLERFRAIAEGRQPVVVQDLVEEVFGNWSESEEDHLINCGYLIEDVFSIDNN